MKLLLFFIASFVLGFVIAQIIFRYRSVGNLRIDHSDPDGEQYLFLELSNDGAKRIKSNTYVSIHVEHKNYISQE